MLKTKTGFKTERQYKYQTNETEGEDPATQHFLHSSPSKETPLHTPIKLEIPLQPQKTIHEESIY